MSSDQKERWQTEAAFFDEKAAKERATGLQIHQDTVRRYANANRAEFAPEYRFMQIGTVRGKRVLDIGCGDGRASILLALLGGIVTGIDISPDAVRLAAERAEANGVRENCNFVCSPLETVDFAPNSFDVIWCDAFLHHVIPDLEAILAAMKKWLSPGGQIMIAEPISLSPTYRALRLMLFRAPDATPDERPLEPAEIRLINAVFPRATSRLFGLASRFAFTLLPNGNYERSAAWRKSVFSASAKADQVLFKVGLASLASQIVFHGRKE